MNIFLHVVKLIRNIFTSTAATTVDSQVRNNTPEDIVDKYTAIPNLQTIIRPSICDKSRTIAHICTSGTLSTISSIDGVEGFPFGSYVDYILDERGWPVLLLNEQSLHTVNIKRNPNVSLFCQLPRSQTAQTTAALSRNSIVGKICAVPAEELSAIKLAFTLVHPYSEQLVDSPKFTFYKIKPEKVRLTLIRIFLKNIYSKLKLLR